MQAGSWPADTSRFAAVSTNPVGPHTNTAGFRSGGQPEDASTVALIRPAGIGDPAGAVRV
jgi:hypothetical protein